jgi:hypothetical protein
LYSYVLLLDIEFDTREASLESLNS